MRSAVISLTNPRQGAQHVMVVDDHPLFCEALAMTLTYSAGRLPSPEFAAVAASCFGVVTILLAWAFLKEAMRPSQWLAVGLVFAGIGTLAVA